jgi:tRNA threonylcarbamoyladenosine biosynthesis protein TsaE
MEKFITHSAKETIALGKQFAKLLKEKDIVILEGALGGGKTTFVKGILRAFNLRAKVLSPSFTLERRYRAKNFNIYHIDLYRLKSVDFFSLGLEEYFYQPKTIVLIEWGQKIEASLTHYIKAEFSFVNKNSRKINFSFK